MSAAAPATAGASAGSTVLGSGPVDSGSADSRPVDSGPACILRFAVTPQPPYYLVSFTSLRNGEDAQGYAEAAARMLELAAQQPGFLGSESVRDADGLGITLSYWRSEADILAWKHQSEHAATRARGRSDWYARFSVRVARVERAYDWARRARVDHGDRT